MGSASIVISAACIGIGFMIVVFLANTHGIPGYIMTPVGLTLIAIGAAIAVARSAIKIPDGEVDSETEKLLETFNKDFEDKFIPNDIRTIRYEMAHHIPRQKLEPNIFGTYCFEGETVMAKKGSDGKSRSSVYAMSGFVLKSDSVCLAQRRISLISDDDPIPGDFIEVKYTELEQAKLTHVPEKKGYEGFARYRHLTVLNNEGKTVVEMPILKDASAEAYVNGINLRIQRAKERAAE